MDTQDSMWINQNGVQKSYPDYGIVKPPTPLINPISESIGPALLNDSQGSLTERWWAAWQAGGNVVIAGAVSGDYGTPTVAFAEVGVIDEITLTFDQLGRPLFFYKLSTNDLKLYWFDPVLNDNTITVIGQGSSPKAIFDYPTDTNQSFTDAVIFYIGTDTQVKYRKQRDRYQVEYSIADLFGVNIISAGLTTENRVQVVVR